MGTTRETQEVLKKSLSGLWSLAGERSWGERGELGTHGEKEGLLMGPLLPLALSLIAACLQEGDLRSKRGQRSQDVEQLPVPPAQSATRGQQLKQYI